MTSNVLLAVVAGVVIGYLLYSLRWILFGVLIACFGEALQVKDANGPTSPQVLRYMIELLIAAVAAAIVYDKIDRLGLVEAWSSIADGWRFALDLIAALAAAIVIVILVQTRPVDRTLALVIADKTPGRG